MGIHRKKDNLRLRGSQTTAFLQTQPQLNDGLQAADFPLGSPLQRVLPSPALSTRLSMRLPHLDVHGLLQLSVYDTDHIHHLSLAPASLHARFLSQRMAAGGNPPTASLSHCLTSSSIHSTSWISVLSSHLSSSPLSALSCRLPPSGAYQSFLSGLLASQHGTLPSFAHTAASVTFLK